MRRRGSHRQPNLKAPFTRGRTYGINKQWTLAGEKKMFRFKLPSNSLGGCDLDIGTSINAFSQEAWGLEHTMEGLANILSPCCTGALSNVLLHKRRDLLSQDVSRYSSRLTLRIKRLELRMQLRYAFLSRI